MRATVLALHFNAQHAMRTIGLFVDDFAVDRLEVAGPAAAGIEFRIRLEQRCAAAHAVIHAALRVIPVFAGERPFGGGVARHLVLDIGQFLSIRGVVLLQRSNGVFREIVSVHGSISRSLAEPKGALKGGPNSGLFIWGLFQEEQLTSRSLAQS